MKCYLSDVFHSIGYQYGIICCAGSSIRIGKSRKNEACYCDFFIYDWLASLLRAFGNSFIPLLCLIFSGVLNVILDLIFVLCFKMGIEGVAVATVISQILSGLICFVYT